MFAPSFVVEERKVAKQYKQNNPQAFRSFEFGSRRVGYVLTGRVKPITVVFVHGSPGDWAAFAKYLSRSRLLEKANLISVDRLGFGESAKGGAERSLKTQALALIATLDHAKISGPVVLVGHSFGGPVIFKAAALGDSRIQSLVSIAGSVDPALEKTKWYQIPADWMLFRWMIPNMLVVCNQEILALKNELLLLDTEWSRISQPIYVIQGLKDDLVPPGNADYIERKRPGENLFVKRLADRDHFIPFFDIELVENVIVEAIEKVAGP